MAKLFTLFWDEGYIWNFSGQKKCVPYLTPERTQHHYQIMLIN
jgi:hypothetical protein